MIYCDELPFGILSPYQYLNTETKNIISYYAGENESLFGMHWEEHLAEIRNSQILSH